MLVNLAGVSPGNGTRGCGAHPGLPDTRLRQPLPVHPRPASM
ncbi:MAG: hypothetical protein AW07_03748 [Candidatus Accumulibacter sp. SK-11]|nr:MAG: hypothetical protein AW07_03748 [Candidatus Accumulibacter sp. SK-11]